MTHFYNIHYAFLIKRCSVCMHFLIEHLILVSLHGLVRGENMELGRDSDTGGQVVYNTIYTIIKFAILTDS